MHNVAGHANLLNMDFSGAVMLDREIALENEIVALRGAAVHAVLRMINHLEDKGVDRNLLMEELDHLSCCDEGQVARIGRCAMLAFKRSGLRTVM